MKRTIKDFIFEKSLLFLALLTLAGLAGIVWFLFKEGMPVLDTISLKHFLTGHDWYPTEDPPSFGIFPLIIGSVSVTLLAAVLAIPLGILCAIFLSEIASSRLRSIFKPFIELLAAFRSYRLCRDDSACTFSSGLLRSPYGTEYIERGHPAGSHGGSDDLHHF